MTIFQKILSLFIAVGLFAGISNKAFSQETSAELEYKPLPKSLLWEITGKGLKRPSYLYGTIHLIPKDSFFITDATKERMAEADELVLEVPIADMGLGDALKMMKYMRMPAGKSLKTILSAEDYAYLDSFMNALPASGGLFSQTSMSSINTIQPTMAMQQISSAYCAEEDAALPEDGFLNIPDDEEDEDDDIPTSRLMGISMGDNVVYELYFTDKFKALDKPVSGLETADEQMEILTSIPVEEQAASLMEAVRNPASLCGELDALVSIYRKHDIQLMIEMSAEDKSMGDHLDNFLDQRNKNWIPQIDKKVQEGNCLFIAVGAAHLAGPNGVIHLLRKDGYTLKPLF
ncbi:MAG: TraB/GumN family protein [Bacteroidia bacterium]